MSNIYDKLQEIKTFVFDVDGVFTDNSILITESGELLRKMNVRDGYAIKVALQEHYNIAIITGGSSKGVIQRFSRLGIDKIFSGIRDKKSVLSQLIKEQGISPASILYMGDDLIDIECLQLAGLACCPKNAEAAVIPHAAYVCQKMGGDGCVREVIQMVLESQQKWNPLR
jgi:3-deoxy-D-manno-octulosonate 8-phosphate phosphatase (KDO 8-P phosphatase)